MLASKKHEDPDRASRQSVARGGVLNAVLIILSLFMIPLFVVKDLSVAERWVMSGVLAAVAVLAALLGWGAASIAQFQSGGAPGKVWSSPPAVVFLLVGMAASALIAGTLLVHLLAQMK